MKRKVPAMRKPGRSSAIRAIRAEILALRGQFGDGPPVSLLATLPTWLRKKRIRPTSMQLEWCWNTINEIRKNGSKAPALAAFGLWLRSTWRELGLPKR